MVLFSQGWETDKNHPVATLKALLNERPLLGAIRRLSNDQFWDAMRKGGFASQYRPFGESEPVRESRRAHAAIAPIVTSRS